MTYMKGSGAFHFEAITLWIVIHTSVAKGFLEDQYIGCFYDITESKTDHSYEGGLTIEGCIAKCQTTYATIENGNACHCREDYGSQLPDSTCNLTCSGNNSELCGGTINQINAYIVYAVCPVGTYGAMCEKGCHCKRYVLCDRTTGNCPDGCYGNWSGSTCNITSRQYIGCYGDLLGGIGNMNNNNRALENCVYCDGTGDYNNNNTLESCSQSCAERNYSYAGPQYTWQCFCGENYNRYGPLDESNCSMACSGNMNEKCGGIFAISVYSVCPVGNYGRSCAGRCHCLNGERCIYQNGSCPSSLCKDGWTGESCSQRDCSLRNGDCYLNETCTHVSLKYSNVSLCRCLNGFHRNKIWENCTDIDECANMICDIQSTICNNTAGGYICTCKRGFTAYNATLCKDIDECEQHTDYCDQASTICSNTPGSYKCRCVDVKSQDVNSKTIAAAVVGFLIGVAVTVVTGVLILHAYRNRHRIFLRKDDQPKVTSSRNEVKPSFSEVNESESNFELPSKKQQALDESSGYASLAAVDNENTIYTCLQ